MQQLLHFLKGFTPRAMASNLARTAASEYEQGVIRVVIIIMVLTSMYYQVAHDGWVYPFGLLIPVVSAYLLFSIGLMLSFFRYRDGSPLRRSGSMVLDIGVTTFAAWHAYEQLFSFFWIYQWLAIGYGARYGRRYLVGAVVLAAGGFGLVSWRGGHLGVDSGLGAEGVIVALVLIPLFVASLIQKAENARREAEEANRAKSRFLANMSHEMRTPLYGVVGSASLMDPARLDAEHRECVETIIASAQTLQSVIEDVLDLSKIEAGKTTLELVACDLPQLVRSTVRMLQHQARAKQLKLDVSLADSVPVQVRADVLHLRQVLVNLIGNAIKFTERGHVDVRVSRRDNPQGGARVLFEVIDTGIGIAAGTQERIFDSFTQADESTTRRFGGTGLGTTIAKQLVELMDGEIGLDSEPECGSRFWFSIPVQVLPASPARPVPLSERHVLVVGQAADSRAELMQRIRPWVAAVHASATQAQALSHLVANIGRNPGGACMVVVDCDHFDQVSALVQGIRSDPELAGIRVVGKGAVPAAVEARMDVCLDAQAPTGTLYRALQDSALQADETVALISGESHVTRTLRVLVVDDQAVNRRLVSRILERSGHTATTAESGEAGLELLTPGAFDVVVVDMMMPTLSGLDVMRGYRFGVGLGDPMPFVVLSGNATMDAQQECRDAGADAFLSKPVDRDTLVNTLLDVVARNADGAGARLRVPR